MGRDELDLTEYQGGDQRRPRNVEYHCCGLVGPRHIHHDDCWPELGISIDRPGIRICAEFIDG